MSIGAFLTSRWLPGKRSVLADTTYDGYRRKVENHIVPALGRIALRRLRRIILTPSTKHYAGATDVWAAVVPVGQERRGSVQRTTEVLKEPLD